MYVLQSGIKHDIKSFTFSGGEESVNVPMVSPNVHCMIFALIRNSADVLKLLMVHDALKRQLNAGLISLNMPYIPYARQDRVCNQGEAFSLQVFSRLINGCNFDKVYVSDPHSDVAPALLNNVSIMPSSSIIMDSSYKWAKYLDALVVSPDAGANKKVADTCKALGIESFIRADKSRNLLTGEILNTEVYCDDLDGRNCIIFDDICDGGRTFIELGKALKLKGAGDVGLFVTHGIFSKGKKVFDGSIDDVYSLYDWTEIK